MSGFVKHKYIQRARGVPFFAAAAFSAFPAFAQLPAPTETPVIGARMPALSPDGKTLAFVWRGDVWVSPSSGGRAYPVTTHVEMDSNPVFSPDGKWIAFTSNRNGNNDIFVVPTAGGEARQMTFSSGSDVVADWSPDGKTLLFAGRRDTPYSSLLGLDVQTLRLSKYTEDYKALSEPAFSPDGKRIAYTRQGFSWTRPRYHGSGAAQLWTVGVDGKDDKSVVSDERQHLWPRFLPDSKTIVTVTVTEDTPNSPKLNEPLAPLKDNVARTPNLYAFPADGGNPKRLTNFVGGSVRCPAVARQSGDIAFEHEHDLYLLPKGQTTPVKLSLFCTSDDKQTLTSRQVFTNSDAGEAKISPDGKTFAFVLKGDIWAVPTDKAKTRNADVAIRLTDWAGFDRNFVWGRDNKTIYFVSDRSGVDSVWRMDVASHGAQPVWTGKTASDEPKLSPDGSLLGFWVRGPLGESSPAGLYVKETKEGATAPRRLISLPTGGQGSFAFSPDNRYVAFTQRSRESGAYNIFIAPLDGSAAPVNVTRLNAFHVQPTWSPDGKYLFFISDRDGDGLFVLPLKLEEARVDELDIKFEKPTAPVKIAVDFEDTAQRIRKLPCPPPSGEISLSQDGQVFFVSGGDAYVCGYDGKDARKLTNGGGVESLRASDDGKTIFFQRSGALYRAPVSPPNPTTQITFVAERIQDARAERKAAFAQFWRTYGARFYDGNFHGRDWNQLRERYEPLLSSVGTRDEFATLLNRMVGELEASHSEVGAAPGGVPSPVSTYLGVYYDYSYNGPGIRVKDVPKRAPGSYAKTRIKPGDYILAIDDTRVSCNENLFKVLNDKANRDLTLLVNDKPTVEGARTVRYRALTNGEWTDIHYRNRVEQSRRIVREKGGDKIGYVHIAGMGGPNQVDFDRELYEYAEGKKAVIIDVRFNGGGNIADQLINWLSMKPYGTYLPRDGYPVPAPGPFISDNARAWDKPIVVLMNEHSFSNAEMFPYAMRANHLAKLVGMPTPGYVIWTGGTTLVDGTTIRLPGSGDYRVDGTTLENDGEKPDVRVEYTTDDYLNGRDPQLEKAVEMLLP